MPPAKLGMNPTSLNFIVFLSIGLALLLLLGIAMYVIHRLSRRQGSRRLSPSDESQSASWPTPPGVLVEMVSRLKRQDQELDTLRREARRRDQDSLRISRNLLSHLPSGVIFFDRQAIVQQANPAARAALGFASPQGLRAAELFRSAEVREADGSVLGQAAMLVQQALATGQALQRKELDYQTPAGEQRRLGLTFSPVAAAALGPGRVREEDLGLICLLTDLTAIRALESELRRRQNLASLGEMAAGIAHEFKNALATISGYAQMLTAGLAGNPGSSDQRLYADRILEQTAALSQMVGEFLLFARPLDAHLEPVALVPLLRECIEELQGQDWPGVEFTLICDLEPHPTESFCRILADPVLLKRVWLNLLRNGAEAIMESAHPERKGVVSVRVATDAVAARVSIADTGSGVPSDLADKIFIPFFTTKSSGSGLGLAVVYKITAAHHGTVSLASSAGGAMFTVTMPLAERVASEFAGAGRPAS